MTTPTGPGNPSHSQWQACQQPNTRTPPHCHHRAPCEDSAHLQVHVALQSPNLLPHNPFTSVKRYPDSFTKQPVPVLSSSPCHPPRELLLPFLPGAPPSIFSQLCIHLVSPKSLSSNRLIGQWCLSVQNPHNLLLTFMGLVALLLLRGNHPRSAPQRWKQRASSSP